MGTGAVDGREPGEPFTYTKEAYHDPKTGMFVQPEADQNHSAFIEDDESGLFIPAPADQRPIRLITTDFQQAYRVKESTEEVLEILANAENVAWLIFTDPVYGTSIHIPSHVAARVCAVTEDWVDMDAMRAQIAEREKARRLHNIQANGGNRFQRRNRG